MFPILWEGHGFALPAWHVLFVIGSFAGCGLSQYLAKAYRPDISESALRHVFLIVYIFGYLGARAFSVFFEELHMHPWDRLTAMFQLGAMTFYGGAIAAGIAVAVYCYFKGLWWFHLSDVAIPGGLLALALGRVGCFLNGDDFGAVVNFPADYSPSVWDHIFYPINPLLNDQLHRYPVQIWECFYALLVAVICAKMLAYKASEKTFLAQTFFNRPGRVGALGIAGYALGRYVLELYRGDYRGWVIENHLSPSQFLSIMLWLFAVYVFFRPKSQKPIP